MLRCRPSAGFARASADWEQRPLESAANEGARWLYIAMVGVATRTQAQGKYRKSTGKVPGKYRERTGKRPGGGGLALDGKGAGGVQGPGERAGPGRGECARGREAGAGARASDRVVASRSPAAAPRHPAACPASAQQHAADPGKQPGFHSMRNFQGECYIWHHIITCIPSHH